MHSTHLIKRLAVFVAALLLVGCATVPRPADVRPQAGPPPYAAWEKVLQRHVDTEGRVNFSAVLRDRADLDRFVAYVYDASPSNRPEAFPSSAHVLAYHLNAYNALAMHKVLATGIPESFAGFKKVSFFFLGKVQVGGNPISLYDYENKVIRPFGDPRIHMALNCMSVSCPRLPREVFVGEKLEQQLERETRMFFNEARNVVVDDAAGVVKLSEILSLFTEDFLAKAPSLIAFVNRYRDVKVPEQYKVEFIPYDWTVNRQPGT